MRDRLTRKVAVIVGTTVIALGAAGYAVAQSGNSREDERKAFLDDAAQRLDVSPERLTSALKEAAIARVDAAVKAGRLTEEQGNEMKERIRAGDGVPFLGGPGGPGHHHRHGPPPGMTAAAEYLGLSEAELRDQLMDGKSLAGVAGDRDKSVDGLKDAMEKAIRADVEQAVEDEKLTQEQADSQLEEVVGRIQGTTDYDAFGEVDFVVEAVPERIDLKRAVFADLDVATPGHAILSSNTSSLSISEMATATSRPERVAGFHFFYPASVMRLIEVIGGERTSESTLQGAANFAQQIRKQPIRCGEQPGFVVNRILNSAVSEIWRAQAEEGTDVREIDRVVQESKAAPMGPFFLSDLLGLDTVVHVAEHLRDSYGERFFVHPGMKELVDAGNLGQKTGKGFYEHG